MNQNELGTRLYEGNIQELFIGASTKLYDSVVHTIGPDGSNTAIPTNNGFLSIINDGKTILETISSNDIAEKYAINTLKESSYATNLQSGDGTSSTIILQHKLLELINAYNTTNVANVITAKYIEDIRDLLLKSLVNYKKNIESEDDLKKIITVALGSDKFTEVVFNAFKGLDKSQKPALVKVTTQRETDCIKMDGLNLAPVEINPVVLKTISPAHDENLDIIILNQEVSRIDKAFTNILQKISTSPRKTILLYTDIKPNVMDQLLYNIQEGALNLIPVRLAMPITQMNDIISDLESYFGCNAFSDLNPYQVEYNNSKFIGVGTGYIMNKDSIIIKNDNNEDYNKEEHLVPANSSVIQVGFITYSQQAEDYRRLEDAIQSAYNAINYGYVLGAGYTYFCLSSEFGDDEKIQPIKDALDYIFILLTPNDLDISMNFISFIENNVYDSYKVAEQVILNAFTVVAQILSTHCLLVPYQRNRINGQIE